uniref:Putative secreted protein n=1 Tax=Anopheles darlingi TaxID=43151 RepID=A0A2M4DD28_ANODA
MSPMKLSSSSSSSSSLSLLVSTVLYPTAGKLRSSFGCGFDFALNPRRYSENLPESSTSTYSGCSMSMTSFAVSALSSNLGSGV